MKDRAYAKINLSLDVFNVREDGYHDIKSIMIPINFYDVVEIRINDNDEFESNVKFLKMNESNSIFKMINLVRERYGITDKFYVNLLKTVPTQAGLGGGTADAASTLRILQKMYKLHLSDEEIRELCVKVGADVYFNYYNTPAIVEGIGDVLTPFELNKTYSVLLVKPRTGVSTKAAYQNLDMEKCDHPDIDKLKTSLEEGTSIEGLIGNSLEQPSLLLNKDIEAIKNTLKGLGAKNVLMSGSGSTVFAISENRDDLLVLNSIMKNKKNFVRLTHTIKGR